MKAIYFSEAVGMFKRRIRIKFKGIKSYKGNDSKICTAIIKDCYDKEKNYFKVSNGHFSAFYARDFGWCTQALLKLGHGKKVLSTLEYALSVFNSHGRIEQAISGSGKAFTFPDRYSPDALAFIIHSLKLADAKGLVKKYKDFLNHEIKKYYEFVINKRTGLVRPDRYFSSIKDYSLRMSSCYDNVMTGMLANDLRQMKILDNPFRKYNYKNLIVKNFWTGYFFLDDLSGHKIISGDANVVPFWSGLINNRAMLKKAIYSLRKEGLDSPFPLKYSSQKFKEHKMIFPEFLAGNYERDAIWPHIGLMYIETVSLVDKKLARQYLRQYKGQIEKHRNFLEVYDRLGRPFNTLFYYADDAMLWCANYLYLKKKLFSK